MLGEADSLGNQALGKYLHSCETYLICTLSLKDKDPDLRWVWLPKVLWPSSWLAVAQTKPSKFSVNLVLFNPCWLTMIDELYLHSYANEPNKSPWRKRIKALLLWEIGHLSSPSRSCLGSLFLHPWRNRGGCVRDPQRTYNTYAYKICTMIFTYTLLEIMLTVNM